MEENLIGRKAEAQSLMEYYNSGRPEFVAVVGRRRIGKTFLIRSVFAERFAFEMTGSIDAPARVQLSNFAYALRDYGYGDTPAPRSWMEAFDMLKQLLSSRLGHGRLVVFIDELPCLDTPRAGFKFAFEHFWNGWASHQPEIMLIVCGSATSWMITNLVDAHGGLHNRLTHEMHLMPFTLGETEEYLQSRGFIWPRLSILQVYGIMGGVPYYLSLLKPELGVAANIDRLFFAQQGALRHEYSRLYSSLFKNSETHVRVLELLASNHKGLMRKEIAAKIGCSSGGLLTKVLQELINCDFIREYHTRERRIKQTDKLYQLTDLYTLFYLTFCARTSTDEEYWTHLTGQPKQNTWYGLTFERVCMLHIPQIKRALGIDRIHTEYYSWRGSDPASVQIDLLIERADRMVNLCEIKYSQGPYTITKDEEMKIRTRVAMFQAAAGLRYGIIPTLITTFGLLPGLHSSVAQAQLTLDSLFE